MDECVQPNFGRSPFAFPLAEYISVCRAVSVACLNTPLQECRATLEAHIQRVSVGEDALHAALGKHALGYLEHHAHVDASLALAAALRLPLSLPVHQTAARKSSLRSVFIFRIRHGKRFSSVEQ
jgi:hypothetical protein